MRSQFVVIKFGEISSYPTLGAKMDSWKTTLVVKGVGEAYLQLQLQETR